MVKKRRDWLDVIGIVGATFLLIEILPLIPGYLREPREDQLVGFEPRYIIAFLIFNILSIGIPAWIHWRYVGDYSRLKSIWFFALFGGIVGGFLGEVALGSSPLLMISYTLLMLIYGQFYRKFIWWKVALGSYLGGVMIENVMNRAPIQIPTMMWIAIFTYPYFWAKIYENRSRNILRQMMADFRWAIVWSIGLGIGAYWLTRSNVSPPMIVLGFSLPYVAVIFRRTFGKK